MGLLNAENCARFYLCEAATLDDAVNLQSEMGLELLAFGDWRNQYQQTRCRCLFQRSCGRSKMVVVNLDGLADFPKSWSYDFSTRERSMKKTKGSGGLEPKLAADGLFNLVARAAIILRQLVDRFPPAL